MTSSTAERTTDAELARTYGAGGSGIPNGLALATFLAAAVGGFTLGLLTTLAEAFPAVKSALTLTKPVGPLSGKTTYAVAVWLIAWVVLGFVMRGKSYSERTMFIWTSVLLGLGLLGTFPVFYELFTVK